MRKAPTSCEIDAFIVQFNPRTRMGRAIVLATGVDGLIALRDIVAIQAVQLLWGMTKAHREPR